MSSKSRPGLTLGELMAAWGRVLNGRAPMLSIEITRECPLSCPGCYAYGDSHLGGERTLRELSDLRGDAWFLVSLIWWSAIAPFTCLWSAANH